jgi:NUMOD3 motif
MSLAKKGRAMPWATREKIRASVHRTYAENPAIAEGIRAKLKGRRHSFESRLRMSAAKCGQTHSDATRAKISASLSGKSCSEATRSKISGSLKGLRRSPVSIAKMVATRRGIFLPGWVPEELAGEFYLMARLHGEEEAASLVRRLKREMQEASA